MKRVWLVGEGKDGMASSIWHEDWHQGIVNDSKGFFLFVI